MRRLFLMASVLGLSVLAASAVSAGQAPRPAVQRCDVTVTAQPDRSATVVAKYTILNPEALKDGTLTLQVVEMPGVSVAGVKAAGGGGPLETSTVKTPGFDKLLLKVPADARGSFSYTLEYTSRATGAFRVPVFVPTFPVAQSVRSFFATVTLPPGTAFHGDEFPRAQSVAQRGGSAVVEIAEVNIPSFIKVEFGPGSAPLMTGSNVTTFFSFLFILAAGSWWVHLKNRQLKAT